MYLLGILLVALILSSVIAGRREPRRLRPGVYLVAAGLVAILMVAVGAITMTGSRVTGAWVLLIVGLCGLVASAALGVFLIGNGAVLLRHEGVRPATLVSSALGVVVLVYSISVIVGIAIGWYVPARSNPVLILLAAVGLPAGYLGAVLVAVLSWSFIYGVRVRRRARREPVRAVIVLGAGLTDGKRVGPLLAARLDRGRELVDVAQRSGRRPIVVCSGGQGADEQVSEAAAMSEYLVARGTDRDRILLEDRSTDTAENLAFSAQILAEHGVGAPVAVVTSDFHAFRAATQMRIAGLDGYSTGAPTARFFVPNAEVREFVAILRDHWPVNVAAVAVLSVPWVIGLWSVLSA